MKKFPSIFVAALLLFVSCDNDDSPNNDPKIIKVTVNPKNNSGVSGQALFTQINDTLVTMSVILEGLTPGKHAIHLHKTADCTSDDGKSTGGHWNPEGKPHGEWGSPTGYHKGDIGNFMADRSGYAVINFSTDQWCIGCDDENSNIIGRGIIVHDGIDDYESQPSGNAGKRIACGEIIE